jgi:hypothetical protein
MLQYRSWPVFAGYTLCQHANTGGSRAAGTEFEKALSRASEQLCNGTAFRIVLGTGNRPVAGAIFANMTDHSASECTDFRLGNDERKGS